MLPDSEKKFDDQFSALISNSKIKKISVPYGEENVAYVYGAKNAKGNFLCFLSPDDEWYAHHLNVFNQEIEKNPAMKVLFTVGEIACGFKDLSIKVSENATLIEQNGLETGGNLSLTQFCIETNFTRPSICTKFLITSTDASLLPSSTQTNSKSVKD